MSETNYAVEYMIDVWDEVTGKTWRESPDHVQQMFLKAEAEMKAISKLEDDGAIPYQQCPICHGQGKILADANTTSMYESCKVCHGKMIIPMYLPPKQDQ